MFVKLNRKVTFGLTLAVVLSLLLAPLALADNVLNDVVVGGNDTFTLGGSTPISYRIQQTGVGNDGQNGCNAADGSAATVTINTPANVSASPNPLLFSDCGVASAQSVEFTASAAGDYLLTVSVADAGAGTYDASHATFTLHVLAPSDSTPPVISPNVSGTLGNNGWYVSDVTVSWSVVDNESSISSSSGCGPTTIDSDTAGTTLTCSAASAGGTNSQSVTIKRDATAPSVSLVGGPADGASYYFGFVPAAPTCSASDATSGLAGACSVSGYGTSVNSHTETASASDNAGNSGSASASYAVLAWTLNGFYSPVDMGILNITKGGSTVPLKFEVFAGTTELNNTSVIQTFTQRISCTVGTGDDIEQYATGGTSLRYDTTSGQFIFNWQTPKAAGTCYRVTMTTQDGSSIYADFRLK